MKYLSGIIAAAATATTLSGAPQEAEAQNFSINIENGQVTGIEGIFENGSVRIDDGSVDLSIGNDFNGLSNGGRRKACRENAVGQYNNDQVTRQQYRQLMKRCQSIPR